MTDEKESLHKKNPVNGQYSPFIQDFCLVYNFYPNCFLPTFIPAL